MRLHFDNIPSTSTYIKEHIAEFNHGDWVSASFQSGGRGQRGNSWESEDGQNALFSIMFTPHAVSPANGFVMNHIVALAVLDVLDYHLPSGLKAMVKWPNDIYVGDKKICGILIESSMSSNRFETAVAGIGLNVNQERFLSDAPNPVSMFQLAGRKYDVDEIMKNAVYAAMNRYERYANGFDFKQEYMYRLYRFNQWHKYIDSDGVMFEGMIVDVLPGGLLVVKTKENKENQLRCFEFKSIKYVI